MNRDQGVPDLLQYGNAMADGPLTRQLPLPEELISHFEAKESCPRPR